MNEYRMNTKQMNLDVTQIGATQNQKQAQARTLLWGKYIKLLTMPRERAHQIERAQSNGSFYYDENDRDISRFSCLGKLWTLDSAHVLTSTWWLH